MQQKLRLVKNNCQPFLIRFNGRMKAAAVARILVLALIVLTGIQVKAADLGTTNQNPAVEKNLETYGWMLAQEKKVAGLDASEPEIQSFIDGFTAGNP